MAVEDFISTVRKSFKGVQNQDNILTQIVDSVRSKTNHIDSKWSLEQQTEIGCGLLLKGLVTKDRKEVMEKLIPDRNWQDTMSTIIVALWQTWVTMWRHRNNSIDHNARYCTQVQDDKNRLSLQTIYSLQHLLSKSIQKVMKRTVDDHLKMHRNQVTDWLTMYRQLIKHIIDEKETETWQQIRGEWIDKNSREG